MSAKSPPFLNSSYCLIQLQKHTWSLDAQEYGIINSEGGAGGAGGGDGCGGGLGGGEGLGGGGGGGGGEGAGGGGDCKVPWGTMAMSAQFQNSSG